MRGNTATNCTTTLFPSSLFLLYCMNCHVRGNDHWTLCGKGEWGNSVDFDNMYVDNNKNLITKIHIVTYNKENITLFTSKLE